ncbi:MAG: hypothetical protein HG464_005400 [Bacteroidia bacterium]|nr:hypothetical protein [Bacteroidia bacterium]
MRKLSLCRIAIFFALLAASSCCQTSFAQQLLRDEVTGKTHGWHFSLHRGAPRVIILPEAADDDAERISLARSLLKLRCNVYIPRMDDVFFNPHTSPDSLTRLTKQAVSEIFRWDHPSEVLLVGAGKSASLALLTSLRDFRVKAVIALSPGEFFGEHYSLTDSLSALSVPVLALYRQEEQKMVRGIFKKSNRRLTVFSPTLHRSGYPALTDSGKRGGEAWLAVSIFYSEQVGE